MAPRATKQTSTAPAAPSPAAGLCFRFLCWDAQTEDHTLELVLCMRCQHSLAWGIDPAKRPQKKTEPGKREKDPPVVLPPVSLPCEWCALFGWTPAYEADEQELRRRDWQAANPTRPRLAPAARVDDDGQVFLF